MTSAQEVGTRTWAVVTEVTGKVPHISRQDPLKKRIPFNFWNSTTFLAMVARKRRRKESAPSEGGANGAPQERRSHPAFSKSGWKTVQLDLDVMKEFEMQGGLFIEEADPAEVGVEYSTVQEPLQAVKRRRLKRTGKAEAAPAEDLTAENEKLRKELAELRSKTQSQEE
ncbi:unnamed protein product, partial [Symbiodinium sp. CCMP2456]